MHFFWQKSAFFRPSLYIYSILLAQVLHHFGREQFSGRSYSIGFQKSTVRLQPTAKSFGTHTRCAGKLNLRSRFHKYNTSINCFIHLFFVYAWFSVVPCGSVVKHHPFFSFSRRDTEGMPNKRLTQLCTFRGRHSRRWFGVCLCGSSTSSCKWWSILGHGGPSMSQSRCEQIEFDSGS